MDTSKAIVLDVETTGLDLDTVRVVEIAAVRLIDGTVLLDTLIDPGIQIPPEAIESHGITDEDVVGAPLFTDIARELASIIREADALVGYNIFYDAEVMDREYRRLALSVQWPRLICGKRIWDTYEPRPRKLVDAHNRFVGGEFRAHRALSDTMATREVILSQIREFGLAEKPWKDVDPEQINWAGYTNHLVWSDDGNEVILNFGKHKGRPIGMVPHGYLRWIMEGNFPGHVRHAAHLTRFYGAARLLAWAKEHLT